MPTYNDYGIVLSSYKLAETDKILNIYTKQNGLVRAIGKGIRKPTSKLTGRVDLLSCCFFQFARGRNLDIICECEQINSFSKLRSDLSKLTHGMLFLEIVNSFAHENESESNQIYDLLYTSIDELQTTPAPSLSSIKFIISFLSIHGYKPQLENCVYCSLELGAQKNEFYSYSPTLGGLLCSNCSKVIDHKIINENILRILLPSPISHLTSSSYADIHQALKLLREHLDIRAKNKIKSFDLVFSL